MLYSQLPNYLLANRKKLGLSQDDVAFLLGTKSGAKVSRYEHFARNPTMENVFACEAIFQIPASELFAGIYQTIQEQVADRAKTLTFQSRLKATDPKTARKRKILL